MSKLFIIFWLIAGSLLAQQMPDEEKPHGEVHGLILNGNKSILILEEGILYGNEEKLYESYFEKIYSDSTRNDIFIPQFSGRRFDYFNPVIFLLIKPGLYFDDSAGKINYDMEK